MVITKKEENEGKRIIRRSKPCIAIWKCNYDQVADNFTTISIRKHSKKILFVYENSLSTILENYEFVDCDVIFETENILYVWNERNNSAYLIQEFENLDTTKTEFLPF